jgi:AraC-like DNA-binding protein
MHHSDESLHKTPQLEQQMLQSPMRILMAGEHSAGKGMDYPTHRDHAWELHYYRHGHIECVIDDNCHESRPGMITMVPPNTLHGEIARTDYANYFVFIQAPAEYTFPRVMFDDQDGAIMNTCMAAIREHDHPNEQESRVMLNALSMQLRILLMRAGRRLQDGQLAGTTAEMVRHAAAIIDQRFASALTIEQVAYEVGVSTSHLRQQFKVMRGMSPATYLQQTRLRNALASLRGTDHTLERVAAACGYDSASHLSRHVKRMTGRSPGALRTSAE